jgi:hypothetical protein
MKTLIFVACFFCATFAFSQTASVVVANPQPLEMSGHTEHASQHAMGQESSLLMQSSYSYAKGEVPLADLASPIYETPLGDVARAYRKEHANAPKAVKVLEKQF